MRTRAPSDRRTRADAGKQADIRSVTLSPCEVTSPEAATDADGEGESDSETSDSDAAAESGTAGAGTTDSVARGGTLDGLGASVADVCCAAGFFVLTGGMRVSGDVDGAGEARLEAPGVMNAFDGGGVVTGGTSTGASCSPSTTIVASPGLFAEFGGGLAGMPSAGVLSLLMTTDAVPRSFSGPGVRSGMLRAALDAWRETRSQGGQSHDLRAVGSVVEHLPTARADAREARARRHRSAKGLAVEGAMLGRDMDGCGGEVGGTLYIVGLMALRERIKGLGA